MLNHAAIIALFWELMNPHFNVAQASELIGYYLPQVSRSFALNIKRLPKSTYVVVGLGYLICRILDTIEDAPPHKLSDANKTLLLNRFSQLIHNNAAPAAYARWLRGPPLSTANTELSLSSHPYENALVYEIPTIIGCCHNLAPAYQRVLQKPIAEMAAGMARFCTRYQTQKTKIISTIAELKEYCGIVAGTVGTLLTELFVLKIPQPAISAKLKQLSSRFALALQLTNIAKDFYTDATRHWCYIPQELFSAHNLSYEAFIAHSNSQKSKAVQMALIALIEPELRAALTYVQTLPHFLNAYRRFCWLPLIMAAQTIALLKSQTMAPHKHYRHKISRLSVGWDLFTTPIVTRSNRLLALYFQAALGSSSQQQ